MDLIQDNLGRDRPMMSAATTCSAISRARSRGPPSRPPTTLTVLTQTRTSRPAFSPSENLLTLYDHIFCPIPWSRDANHCRRPSPSQRRRTWCANVHSSRLTTYTHLPAAVMAEASGGLAFVVGFDQRCEIGGH